MPIDTRVGLDASTGVFTPTGFAAANNATFYRIAPVVATDSAYVYLRDFHSGGAAVSGTEVMATEIVVVP